ncbi:hypothetical protein A4A49_10296 [Nicotiana attenuata]|uniref:Uncharacterized protein n=1 Tax=Nicotiana attenuata TaxID=49451 RepID=A0A1J6J631_NICAT|nr:hypothetical protein A4A49_10296 [Nicotiana attenuata]
MALYQKAVPLVNKISYQYSYTVCPFFEHEQLNYAHGQGNKAAETVKLMKEADEDEHKDHMQIIDFEEQCAGVETQIDQISKNCNLQMQCNDENEHFKENDQANSCNEKATSEHSPCRTYTMVVQNVAASAVKNLSIDDQHSDMIEPNNHEGNLIHEQENQSMGDKGIINPDGSLPESSTSSEQAFLPIQLYSVPGFEHELQAVETIDLMQPAYKDEDEGQMQIMNFEEQCVDAETQIDQFAKKCNLQMQFSDKHEHSTENDQENSCCEEATSENNPCRTYSMIVQNLAASAIRNASIDDQHSAEVVQVIKETNATDITPGGEQSPEAEHSPIRFVEKQSFERNYQGTGLEEDKETSESLAVNIEAVEKDLEARSREAEDEVAESVFVDKEEDDGYDNDIDKEDVAEEIADDISETPPSNPTLKKFGQLTQTRNFYWSSKRKR